MPLHPATDDVLCLAERVRSLTSSEVALGRTEELRLRSAWLSERGLTVVVVGEQKRGKSSLINALVGRPGLLPVDIDVATSAFLSVSHGPNDRAVLLGDVPREIALGDIPEYSSIDPDTGIDRHPDVIGLEVEIPADILADGLTLVDTPGVGGLLAGHADITLGALGSADVLLFVLNESMELSSSELEFLRRATSRTGHTLFLFVLNAIDRNLNWPDTLERNMQLLREHAPEYAQCPWFPVSSRFKTQADQSAPTEPDFAQDLLHRSRCDALLHALREEVGPRVQAGRLRGLIDLCGTVLAEAESRFAEQERALRQDESLDAELTERRRRLAAVLEHPTPWQSRLAPLVEDLRGRLLQDVDARLVAVRTEQLHAAARGGRAMPAQVERDLSDSLRGLKVAFDTTLYAGLSAVCEELCATFQASGIQLAPAELRLGAAHDGDLRTQPAPAPDPGAGVPADPGAPHHAPGGGWLSDALGGGAVGQAVGGAVGGAVPAFFAALGAVATAGAAVVAAVGAVFLIRRSSASRRRAEVEARIGTVIERRRDDFPTELTTTLRQFARTLALAVTEALQTQLRQTDTAIADATERRTAEQAALAPLLEATRRRRAGVGSLQAEADGLRARLDV